MAADLGPSIQPYWLKQSQSTTDLFNYKMINNHTLNTIQLKVHLTQNLDSYLFVHELM